MTVTGESIICLLLTKGYIYCLHSYTSPHRQCCRSYLCLSHLLNPYLMISKWPLFSCYFSLPLNGWGARNLHAVWTKLRRNCDAYTWGSSVGAPQLKQRRELVFVLFQGSRKQTHLNHRWLTAAYTPKGGGRKALAVVLEARLLHIPTYYWIFRVFLGTGKKEVGWQAIAAESQPPSSSTLFPTASCFGHVSGEGAQQTLDSDHSWNCAKYA